MRNARQYRGIDVTDGGRDGDLRQIRRCRFSNSQHSRGFDAPARGRGSDLRHIRRCRFRNRQHSRGFDAPDREKADTIEESQSRAPILPCFIGPPGGQVVRFAGGTPFFCPAGPQNRGTFESRVAQFACCTPVLAPRSVKTRHNGGPEAPGWPPASHGGENRGQAPPK